MDDYLPAELMSILVKRRALIGYIRTSTMDKRELEEKLDVSRPTIDRAFRELEDGDIISSIGTDYELTLFGKLVHDEFADTWRSIEKITEAHPLLEQLPPDLDFPAGFFDAGEIHLSNPKVQAEPFQHVWDLLEGCDEFEALLPVMTPEYLRRFHDTVVKQGISGEIVLEEDVEGTLFASYEEMLTDLLDIEHCSLWSTKRAIPIGLVVVDGTVLWTGFYGPAGGLRGAIVNESDVAVTWGNEQFETYREQSDPVITRGSATRHRKESPTDAYLRNNRILPSDIST